MGGYLSEPVTEKISDEGEGLGLRWGTSAMQGWRVDMEDAHIATETEGHVGFFGVFDGHGGKEVARFCSANSVEVFNKFFWGDCDAALRNTFHGIDDLLRDPEHQKQLDQWRSGTESQGKGRVTEFLQSSIQSDLMSAKEKGCLTKQFATQVMMKMIMLKRFKQEKKTPSEPVPADEEAECSQVQVSQTPPAPSTNYESCVVDHVGCTAVVAVVEPDKITVANAGDSRCVLCRGGVAVPMSYDHKPNSDIERGRITKAGGKVVEATNGARTHYRVNGNLNLSRAIGDFEYKKNRDLKPEEQMICATPDVISLERHPSDEFLILACDGIWDVKSNQEAVDFIKARLTLERPIYTICEEFLDECVTKEHPKETAGIGGDNMTCIIVLLNGHAV